MRYDLTEDEIVARLQSSDDLTAIMDIMAMPEDEDELKKPLLKPLAIVTYAGSKYDSPNSTGNVTQWLTASFEIIVQARNRRGDSANPGIYICLEAIKILLVGYDPTDLNQLYLTDEDIVSYSEEGVWTYRLMFSARGYSIEANNGAIDVLLQQPDIISTVTNGL